MPSPDTEASVSVGVVFRPQLPPEHLVEAASAADQYGLDELWLWEDCFLEAGVSMAATALASSQRLVVGIGLLPVPLRNVALTGMELATLARLFPERVVAALGHGVQEWMCQVGARVDSPMTLLREYTEALTSLLAGQRVTRGGRYITLHDVQLGWPPAAPFPVLIGGVGPKTLQLAGELADGMVLTGGTTPDQVKAAVREVAAGRARARPRESRRVVAYIPTVFGGADATARFEEEGRRWGWALHDRVGVAGNTDEVSRGLHSWLAAGVNHLVLQPPQDETNLPAYIEQAAQVASQLREDWQRSL